MITWNIVKLDVKPTSDDLTNVVVTAHWDCTISEETHSSRVYGTISFPEPSESFIDYDSLTKEQVLSWVWENGVDKEQTEASLTSQLELLKNPPIIHPALPWTETISPE
jgi:hypothetical protein